jgi:hypothetical protein
MEAEKVLRQPQNFWLNIALTLVVMGTMVVLGDKLAQAIVFMVGTCLGSGSMRMPAPCCSWLPSCSPPACSPASCKTAAC